MRSRGVRMLILLLAIAALAAAGTAVWQIERRIDAARTATDTFESGARQAVVSLGDWRAAQQASIADGQPAQAWLAKAAGIGEALGPKLSALRAQAVTAEAQGAMESAIEAFNALMRNDAKARDYANAGQRFSASDVIFTDSESALERAVIGIDTARGQERVAFAVAFETLRRWELIAVGAAGGLLLLAVLLLTPLPAAAGEAGAEERGEEIVIPRGAGLSLSHDAADGVVRGARPVEDVSPAEAPDRGPGAAGRTGPTLGSKRSSRDAELGTIDFALDAPASAKGPDLEAIADLCSSLARVQDTRELQGLLDRTARALGAAGIIVWMP